MYTDIFFIYLTDHFPILEHWCQEMEKYPIEASFDGFWGSKFVKVSVV